MKYLTFFSTILAIASAAPLAEEAVAQDVQAPPSKAGVPTVDPTRNGYKILPRFQEVPPTAGTRVTKKIGTYSVSSSKMLSTFKMVSDSPCSLAGCYVTAMEATIRYPDGKEANIDTKAWLHHIALFGSGTGGGSIWACGNERPTLRLNSKEKYGIDWPKTWMMMIDLMTEDPAPKSLTLEITYEVVPKTTPGYKGATMYWLTIGEPAAKEGAYTFKPMLPTKATGPGKLLYAIGHMHDGGTKMSLTVNGRSVCESQMFYALRPGYTPPGGAAAHGGHGGHSRRDGPGAAGMEHISDPGACTDFGSIAAGDSLSTEAFYDANLHPLMVHNGAKEKLMGNLRVYVGPT